MRTNQPARKHDGMIDRGENMAAMSAAGMSNRQIARVFQVSDTRVSEILRSRGVRKKARCRHKTNGYVLVQRPNHPAANRRGNVLEHRIVAEEAIGRLLTSEECVHHVNRVRDDNRPENLRVMSISAHSRLHGLEGRFSEDLLVDLLCWLALRLGHTPRTADFRDNGVCIRTFFRRGKTLRERFAFLGLEPNKRGGRHPKPIPDWFHRVHGHLLRFSSARDLVADRRAAS